MRVTVIRDPILTAAQVRVARAAGLAALLRQCSDELGVRAGASITIRLADDAQLRELNRRFLGEDAPTDVLAFPGDGRLPAAGHAGDIAISVEQAQRQA